MPHPAWIPVAAVALIILVGDASSSIQREQSWTDRFDIDAGELAASGRNPYFILEPGYRLVLEDGGARLTITVLAETRRVDGVETRVVEERETKGGDVVEISRNYYAISERTNSIFYFGEDVDIYKQGRIDSHDGAWLAGVSGARFGLMMPGVPLVGGRYYQELAPKVRMDRARIVGVEGTVATAAGSFARVLRVEESTPLEPGTLELKLYAPGVGLVQDGSLKLVRYGVTVAP